ncbi:MAG: hypothetical protein AAFU64_01305 [Bacteroidota bacterium]
MENLSLIIKEINQDLSKEDTGASIPSTSAMDFEQLKNALRLILQNKMDRDMPGLINLAYRMDLNESVFNQALQEGNAESLAEAFIQRALQKVEIRRKYSSGDF